MKYKRIGEILIDNNAITQENLDRGLSEEREVNDNETIKINISKKKCL